MQFEALKMDRALMDMAAVAVQAWVSELAANVSLGISTLHPSADIPYLT